MNAFIDRELTHAIRQGTPDRQPAIVATARAAPSCCTCCRRAALADLGVDMLEQPVPAEADGDLQAGRCPIPVCADESIDTLEDLPRVRQRYDFINIKLDKAGGLTASLQLAQAARDAGMRLMVGCMNGGSAAMAPGMVLAQLCEVVDLDGPLLQAEDWPGGIAYDSGRMAWPDPALWG